MIAVKKVDVETCLGMGQAHIPHMDGIKAGRFFTWLAKKLGPGLVALAEGSKNNRAEAGLAALTQQLDEADFDRVINTLLAGTRVLVSSEFHDLPDSYGKLFAGKTFAGFGLIWEAFQHNYGNFSSALGGLSGLATAPKA